MKDVYAVLHQKEIDLARVREEIKALRFAIPLLAEGSVHVPDVTDRFSTSSRQESSGGASGTRTADTASFSH
jgi:hypothetical protein